MTTRDDGNLDSPFLLLLTLVVAVVVAIPQVRKDGLELVVVADGEKANVPLMQNSVKANVTEAANFVDILNNQFDTSVFPIMFVLQ